MKATGVLIEALNKQGRQFEAMALGKELGDFWKDKKRDATALPELVRRLEAKLLPVPGTEVLMGKTEFTVGEWKLYLRAEGLPGWQQPSKDFEQTDEHPVVNVTIESVKEFCARLSSKTGQEWRLPNGKEWTKVVGTFAYPWGDYYPPHWDDGNYAILADGKEDPENVGVDGVFGTAPVGSFKPNALGFYDLGGNVSEWADEAFEKKGHVCRGGAWDAASEKTRNLHVSLWPPCTRVRHVWAFVWCARLRLWFCLIFTRCLGAGRRFMLNQNQFCSVSEACRLGRSPLTAPADAGGGPRGRDAGVEFEQG